MLDKVRELHYESKEVRMNCENENCQNCANWEAKPCPIVAKWREPVQIKVTVNCENFKAKPEGPFDVYRAGSNNYFICYEREQYLVILARDEKDAKLGARRLNKLWAKRASE